MAGPSVSPPRRSDSTELVPPRILAIPPTDRSLFAALDVKWSRRPWLPPDTTQCDLLGASYRRGRDIPGCRSDSLCGAPGIHSTGLVVRPFLEGAFSRGMEASTAHMEARLTNHDGRESHFHILEHCFNRQSFFGSLSSLPPVLTHPWEPRALEPWRGGGLAASPVPTTASLGLG